MQTKEKIKNFKDLQVWQEGHKLVLLVYKMTKIFPKEELFGLTSQLRRAAVSITSNIAEGFSRDSYKEKTRFYSMAHGSLTEVENQIMIAFDIGYLNKLDFKETTEQLDIVHRLLNAFIKKTRSFC
jgi:four helix bundle protein